MKVLSFQNKIKNFLSDSWNGKEKSWKVFLSIIAARLLISATTLLIAYLIKSLGIPHSKTIILPIICIGAVLSTSISVWGAVSLWKTSENDNIFLKCLFRLYSILLSISFLKSIAKLVIGLVMGLASLIIKLQ